MYSCFANTEVLLSETFTPRFGKFIYIKSFLCLYAFQENFKKAVQLLSLLPNSESNIVNRRDMVEQSKPGDMIIKYK